MKHPLTFKGAIYDLHFSFDTVCRLEEECGVNVFNSATYSPSPRLACVLVWGGLIESIPTLKLADVRAAFPDISSAAAASRRAVDALIDAIPEMQPAESSKADAIDAPKKS